MSLRDPGAKKRMAVARDISDILATLRDVHKFASMMEKNLLAAQQAGRPPNKEALEYTWVNLKANVDALKDNGGTSYFKTTRGGRRVASLRDL